MGIFLTSKCIALRQFFARVAHFISNGDNGRSLPSEFVLLLAYYSQFLGERYLKENICLIGQYDILVLFFPNTSIAWKTFKRTVAHYTLMPTSDKIGQAGSGSDAERSLLLILAKNPLAWASLIKPA